MDQLSRVELAERSGSSPERIDRLVELGVITPQADRSFRPADIQRVKLIDALERSGIRLEDLGRAVRSGRLSFAFLDLLFTEPKGYSAKTYQDVCAEYGWTLEFVERIHEALGLPVPSAEDRVREDDMQMFPIGQFALATFVLSPCLTTAGLLGRAGVWCTIGQRVPFRPLNSADRRSLAAVRLRGVVRRSMRPPDRMLVPNRLPIATDIRLPATPRRLRSPPHGVDGCPTAAHVRAVVVNLGVKIHARSLGQHRFGDAYHSAMSNRPNGSERTAQERVRPCISLHLG